MVSKGWVKKLLEETKQWVSDGLISHDQEVRISSRYSGRMEYSRLINTITTLGSILIGLGILLFVASNWDKLGRPSKIAIIFLVIHLLISPVIISVISKKVIRVWGKGSC